MYDDARPVYPAEALDAIVYCQGDQMSERPASAKSAAGRAGETGEGNPDAVLGRV